MRTCSALFVGTVACVLATAAGAQERKWEPERARVWLDSQRGSGAAVCPDARAVEAAVAGRLGYEPFDPDSTDRVRVTVTRGDHAVEARIERMDPTGAPAAERVLRSRQLDCRELGATLELALAIAIDPFRAVPSPPPWAPVPATGGSANTVAIVVAAPPPPAATPHQPLAVRLTVGAVGATGSAPTRSLGIVAGVSARHRRLSLGLEGRADLSGSVPLAVGEISASLLVGSLVPCFHFARLATCAIVTGGVLRAGGYRLDEARRVASPYVAAGARVGTDYQLTRFVLAFAQADLAAPIIETELRVDGQALWTTPAVSLAMAIGVAVSIP